MIIKKRAAIIGCGNISIMHGNAIKRLLQVKLVACADIIKDRAEKFARKYECSSYTDYKEMLDKEDIDVVHICTDHDKHLELITYAVNKGIAVFTEKPPVITEDEYKKLLELEERAAIGICFQNRYNETIVYAREIQEKEHLGKTIGGRGFVTWHREMDYYESGMWRKNIATAGGGSLMNQSIHTLDLLVSFLGPAIKVSATIANHDDNKKIEVEDTVEAFVEFEGGKALFYGSNNYCIDEEVMLEICYENGTIRIEGSNICIKKKNGTLLQKNFSNDSSEGKAYWGNGHNRCIEAFYKSLEKNMKFPINPTSIEATMDTVFKIYKSARSK